MAGPAVYVREARRLRELWNRYKSDMKPKWHIRRLRKAEADAKLLMYAAASGTSATRDFMAHPEIGVMTENDWHWAIGLLRFCGLAYRFGEPGIGIKPISTRGELEEKLTALREQREYLETQDDDLTLVRVHMPRRYHKES